VSENLDLVRSIYADWERGDYGRSDWADTEIEFVIADGPAPAEARGIAAMANAYRGLLQGLEHVRSQAEEYRELDGGYVLVLNRVGGRGKESGLASDGRGVDLFCIVDGKVTRLVSYFHRGRALADLGLQE
jgi:ketosteroid isomerase-like protein